MEKTKLCFEFLDSLNQKFRFNIDEARENLTLEEIRQGGKKIIELDIFSSKGNNLETLSGVRKVRTVTEELAI